MTKKPYPKTPRVSRSTRRRPTPVSTGDRFSRAYPFPRHYRDLDGHEQHPVDAVISRIPKIATLDRSLVRRSQRWKAQVRDVQGYIAYEDARLHQRVLREEAHFDAGHREGRLIGLVESLSASSAASAKARELAQQIRVATMTTILPPDRIVAVLLEAARALVLGQQLPALPPPRGRR